MRTDFAGSGEADQTDEFGNVIRPAGCTDWADLEIKTRRFRQQAQAAERSWPALHAAILKAARETYPNAKIIELGDEILIEPYTDDPEAARLKAITCQECHGKLDNRGTCPDCGWA